MKLFITGGSGYIGRYLVSSLIKKSINLKLLLKRLDTPAINSSNLVTPIYGDLRNREFLIESLADVNAVIHVGALVGSTRIEVPDQ